MAPAPKIQVPKWNGPRPAAWPARERPRGSRSSRSTHRPARSFCSRRRGPACLRSSLKTNSQQYIKRGWCLMEFYASGIVKDSYNLISLSKLSGEETGWYDVYSKGRAGRAPPMAPAAFAVKLESGVATGEVGFTNKGDVPLVTGIYDKAFMTEMTKATELDYSGLEWDDAQGVQLCEALRHAHAHGGLRELKSLDLSWNKLGDAFVTALVALLDEGGLANVEALVLRSNAISDAGMRELAAAVACGGLPKCTRLRLRGNPGSDAPVYGPGVSP